MLVLSRKSGESIQIGTDINVTVVRTGPEKCRIGIEAPRSVHVRRSELAEHEFQPDQPSVLTPEGLAARLLAASNDGEGVLILVGHHNDVAHCRAQVEQLGCRERLSAVLAIGLDGEAVKS